MANRTEVVEQELIDKESKLIVGKIETIVQAVGSYKNLTSQVAEASNMKKLAFVDDCVEQLKSAVNSLHETAQVLRKTVMVYCDKVNNDIDSEIKSL